MENGELKIEDGEYRSALLNLIALPNPIPSPLTGEGKDGGAARDIQMMGTPSSILPRRGEGGKSSM